MAKSKQRKAEDKQPEPKAERARGKRDPRPFIYAGLDFLFGVLYIIAFSSYAVNRHTWAAVLMWSLPVAVLLMGLCTLFGALLSGPRSARFTWWVIGIVAVLGSALTFVLVVATGGAFVKTLASAFMVGVLLPVARLARSPNAARFARYAWIAAVAMGALMLLISIVLLALLLASAAFLSGVYGSFGKAAASGVLAGAALVAELIALLPVFQTKYLLTRAGRRAFGQPPLWRKAAAA